MQRNNAVAAKNRAFFRQNGILSLNLMSSPGSGKTTLLEETVRRLKGQVPVAVIEGDQQTSFDADRIAALEVPVYQVNTGDGCHLDAAMIHHALHHLSPPPHSILFIENVGNLVCPANFDLGEALKVVIVSLTEGDDKPLKYPGMFHAADICIINKIDLAQYLNSNMVALHANICKVNPNVHIFEVSSTRGDGFKQWCEYLLHYADKN
jgi:hydrogenase nickel incorporation protein HypB